MNFERDHGLGEIDDDGHVDPRFRRHRFVCRCGTPGIWLYSRVQAQAGHAMHRSEKRREIAAAKPFDIVVAADRSWGIGLKNAMPWPRLKGDLQYFKRVTSEAVDGSMNAVIMGRRTWDSIGKPLPGRHNIVITRRKLDFPDGVRLTGQLDEALVVAQEVNADRVFVIGGGQIYRLALEHPALRWILLTRIDAAYESDVTLPDLGARGLVGTALAEPRTENDVTYSFERWERKAT
jgi:dihydrofolate reductase/thymidylate synthase